MSGGLAQACAWVFKRDWLVVARHRSEAANPLLFFLMVASLFPLAAGSDPVMLKKIAPGVIWVAALLAKLLALESLLRSDYDDGGIEHLLLSPFPLPVLMLAKTAAHWTVTGLPLLLLTPLLAVQFNLDGPALRVLLLSLLLGTPALSLLGSIGVALTVGLRRGGLLLSLLLIPLYVPILIFAAGAVESVAQGLPAKAHLYMLAALLVLALSLAPFAGAAALRIRMN
jgi:heme exporter protein B